MPLRTVTLVNRQLALILAIGSALSLLAVLTLAAPAFAVIGIIRA